MVATRRTIEVKPGSELASLLDDPSELPVELVKDGAHYRLERADREETKKTDSLDQNEHPRLPNALVGAWIGTGDPNEGWEGHDPERARRILAETAGSWADVDVDALIEELRRAREEGSRPMERLDPFDEE